MAEDKSHGPSKTFVDDNSDAKDMQTNISLRHFGKQLIIFKLIFVPNPSNPFTPDYSDDTEGVISIMQALTGASFIPGPRIFQVE